MGAALIAMVAPAGALAQSNPPLLTTSFTPALIAVGGTSALGFTITNPNSSGSLTNVSLTDNLPAGLVVDNPPGTTISSTCNGKTSSASVTATPGTSTITISGATVAPGAAAACTVAVSVTSNAVGVVQNTAGPVTATGTSPGNSDTESLTVAGLPTVSIRAPRGGSTFTYKQKVRARFSCHEGALGPGLSDCSADDSRGGSIASGHRLNTSVLGTHTITVSASSNDGQLTEETVTYTVLPANHLPVKWVTPAASGAVRIGLNLPGPGNVQILESAPVAGAATVSLAPGAGKFVFGRLTKTVDHAGRVRLTVKPTRRGAALLANQGSGVTVRLTVVYTPAHGSPSTVNVPGVAFPQQ